MDKKVERVHRGQSGVFRGIGIEDLKVMTLTFSKRLNVQNFSNAPRKCPPPL